jgi:uncharacterized protein
MEKQWPLIKHTFNSAFRTSLHYAIASVDEAGDPHLTPIGSLLLLEPGKGIYFEEFTRQLPRNCRHGGKVCVMAVNSGLWFWLRALIRGRFTTPPALRLYGRVGELRKATDGEIALWQKRVRKVRHTKGHALMWRRMRNVREIVFTHMVQVNMGEMTRKSWL